MINRWWIYQRERFPLLAHGPLIAAFSVSAVNFSALSRGATPDPKAILVAFVTALLLFLQLRIADEFKDYYDDLLYRPYRPVPRGLVKLSELKIVGFAVAVAQLGLAIYLDRSLIPLLVLVWLYLSVMSKEFFVSAWLKKHPLTYMWSHMLILPLLTLYVTACDWLVAGSKPASGLVWFLGVSFFNGMVIEIGRKIRAPEEEERGVETYSSLWGLRCAVLAWLSALLLTAANALFAAARIGILVSLTGLLTLLLSIAAIVAWLLLVEPISKHAKLFQPTSGIWTLLLYCALGVFPWLFGV